MKRIVLVVFAMTLWPAMVFAIDGQVLINQSTVMSAGGFPYLITQPGSYKLSGNLTVNANTDSAIRISADNVTLDLNGFTINGNSNATFCVAVVSHLGIVVKNGHIIGCNTGVNFNSVSASIIDGIIVTNHVNAGIGFTNAEGNTIRNSTSNFNHVGISFGNSCPSLLINNLTFLNSSGNISGAVDNGFGPCVFDNNVAP